MGSDTPPGRAIHPAADLVTVTVNLRQTSADFLDRLSQEMEVDRSETCRQIIDLMLQNAETVERGASVEKNTVTFLRDRNLARPLGGGEERETVHKWTNWTIALDRRQFQVLTESAEDDGHSISRAIRHLIAAFMKRTEQSSRKAGAVLSRQGVDQPLLRRNPVEGNPRAVRQARKSPRTKKRSHNQKWPTAAVLSALAAAAIFFVLGDAPFVRGPTVVTAAPWAGRAADVLFDHHNHTKFSDGALSVAALVDLARDAGCNALAITDHSDAAGTASDLQLESLRELRREHLGFLLFGGVEINMPSYGDRQHANVIVAPAAEDEMLPRLRDAAEARIDNAQPGSDKKASDERFLRLVSTYLARGDNLVMVYNHPSRQDRDTGENYADMVRWNAKETLFIGFAGAPGHQNARELGGYSEIGGYREPILTIDRWDPVVAEVGGTWDRLLSEGRQLWGAFAGSDFHNRRRDRIPCDFARTHIAAAEFSYEAVLDALRAGTFWADHGQILNQLSFSAEIAGLEHPVYPGSIVDLGGERNSIVARVALRRGPGAAGASLQVEFIGNCRTGETEILSVEQVESGSTTAIATIEPASAGADNESCFLRARVRLGIDAQPDLMAYTNPIRFFLR